MNILDLKKVIVEKTIGSLSVDDLFFVQKKLELAKKIYFKYDRTSGKAVEAVVSNELPECYLRELIVLLAERAVLENDISLMNTCLKSVKKNRLDLDLDDLLKKILLNF